ncbi:hypothetical protein SAMN04487981_12475 [Streptomyces sp. cf386]|uniref:hypothetical protein n=1 Tax=Streptomyces sp. cf386 TaxID=1761904 RepID=UPI00088D8F57|nr:hypothetical protein [Streptomyces sp. cf386]SDP49693.1 hypothetical protein SAMN04487981_12475 [Streptomyces sp. cf386]
MAVSLGMRVSGLLVVGAVAVAAAAFTSDGGGSADGRGGGGTVVTAGPSDGVRSLLPGPSVGSAPPVRPSPDGHIGAPAVIGTPRTSQGEPPGERPTPSSPSPTMSQKLLEVPAWLPPGPDSPNTDGTPDPSSVYDLLRTPTECRNALSAIPSTPADAEWTLLRGLATACLAVQGEGGSWQQAVRDHAAMADRADTCKGRAAYAVLGGLLDFHRRHPGATVRLKPTSSGTTAACGYRIAGVDTGGDGQARPGETIGIELADVYFDPAELVRDGVVSIGGQEVPWVPTLVGRRPVLSVVVPVMEPGPVDVALRYTGTEVHMPTAFTVTAPDVVQEPSTGTGPNTSPAPQGVLPLGPLPAHHPGPHAPAGLRIP